MQEWKDWAFSITAFLMFASLWEQLFPGSQNRKWLRFFWGILFLLVVIKPIAGWFQIDHLLERHVEVFAEIWNEEMETVPDAEFIEARLEDVVLDAYEAQVREQIMIMAKDAGYILTEPVVELNRDLETESYGKVCRIEAKGVRESDLDVVQTVQIAAIRIGDADLPERLRVDGLSDDIADQYGLERGCVLIWMEED